MGNLIGKTLLLGVLAITAYRDWKEQCIYLYVPMLAGIAGLILHLLYQEHAITDVLWGTGIGVIAILVAVISGESIGIGDGVMLMVSGIFLGFWGNLALLLTALLLVGATALFLVVIKRKGRDYRVPFLPFLLVAYLFQLG